uniref:Nuclear receptor domain-containing protein n=1 Tax=Panagrolaimus sp. PS1159 TaxID=55785 RepID=A0AC35GNR2_9BILA
MSESKLHLKLRQIKNCAICGAEGASQKNGVYSCEGCTEFYEKTIKKHKRYNCRFQDNCIIKNSNQGMGIPLRYSHQNATTTATAIPSAAAAPIPATTATVPSTSSTYSIPSTSSSDIVYLSTTPVTFSRTQKDHVSRILILENCVFVACLCPAFTLPYLRLEDDSQLLYVASANFGALLTSSHHYPVTDRFFTLFVEASECLSPKENLIIHQVRTILEQYIYASAEIVKTQINNEYEFAALSQMTIIKIAGEQSATTETELTQFVDRVSSEYRQFCRESGEGFNDCKFWNLITATNKIHSYRQSTKKQIQQLLEPKEP